MSNNSETFNTLEEVATKFRRSAKKHTLLFAHNGTGKTRLSMYFRELGGCPKTHLSARTALKFGSKCSFTPVNCAFSPNFALF
jgi:hypothetical protein